MREPTLLTLVILVIALGAVSVLRPPVTPVEDLRPGVRQKAEDVAESRLFTNVRQITFGGRRSGEGYFSADGRHLMVTEKATNLITVYGVGADGTLGAGVPQASAGATPRSGAPTAAVAWRVHASATARHARIKLS